MVRGKWVFAVGRSVKLIKLDHSSFLSNEEVIIRWDGMDAFD